MVINKIIFPFNEMEYIILIGSNAKSNWELLELSNYNDILFHVDLYSSCYVVLQNNMNLKLKDVPRQVIKRCGCLCKSNSSSKKLNRVEIIYSNIENCVKGKKEGSVEIKNEKKVRV